MPFRKELGTASYGEDERGRIIVQPGSNACGNIGKRPDPGNETMIADTLANSSLYRGLSPLVTLAFDFLHGTDLRRAATGTVEIDGRRVYAIVQEYATLDRTQGSWEAHRRYIDLQYVVSGEERIGYARVNRLVPGRYDEAKDLLPLSGEGDFLTLGAGDFMLLFPEDAHMPRIAVNTSGIVRKVFVKIAVSP